MMEPGVSALLEGPDGGGIMPEPPRSMGDGVELLPSLCPASGPC